MKIPREFETLDQQFDLIATLARDANLGIGDETDERTRQQLRLIELECVNARKRLRKLQAEVQEPDCDWSGSE